MDMKERVIKLSELNKFYSALLFNIREYIEMCTEAKIKKKKKQIQGLSTSW